MSENQNRDFAKYDAMTTEELEEILRKDSLAPDGQEADGELLLYVMGVLAHRKRHSENPGKTAQQAYESFKEHYLPKQNAARKPCCRWIAAAAVLAVLIAVPFTARALTWDELWSAVATWAKNTFSFAGQEQTDPTEPSGQDDRPYRSLQELLAETNSDTDIVPTWIPDRYSLADIEMDETPMQRNYVAIYANGEQRLKFTVKSYIATDPEKIEINEDLIEVYTVNNIDFYIFSNFERLRVIWLDGSYECNIVGDVTIDEIKLMIDSIAKG